MKTPSPQSSTPKAWLTWLLFPSAGILQTLALAPYDFWILGILSITALMFGLKRIPSHRGALAGWLFGLGLFGSGASWVYISIHTYGAASVPLAGFLTILFVAGLALFPALIFWLLRRYVPEPDTTFSLFFVGIWILGDYFRSFFLTGFPWLYLGYGHLQSPLAGWAPITGVHGLSMITLLSGASIYLLIQAARSKSWMRAIGTSTITLALWISGGILQPIDWTTSVNTDPLSVALIQGNIPQNEKWKPEYRAKSLAIYESLSEPYWANTDIILWPETAIPILLDQAYPYLKEMAERGLKDKTTLISGIPYRGPSTYSTDIVFHNSIVAMGTGSGLYHKQKLVPFGEYVPLEQQLRGLIQFFDLPMSNFAKGPEQQPLLTARDATIASYICYEVVYPDFAAELAAQAQLLLTISNDSWFGTSIGPLQHLQMAQMRALENQRYMIRGTNNGVSAIIDDRGRMIEQSPQFERVSLRGEVRLKEGLTPFQIWGSWPVLALAWLLTMMGQKARIMARLRPSASAT